VPSARPQIARAAALAACASLLAVGAAGCSTTQEKAERQQAESERILDARKERDKK